MSRTQPRAGRVQPGRSWRALNAAGLVGITASYSLSRGGDTHPLAYVLFWFGFALLIAPEVFVLCVRSDLPRANSAGYAFVVGLGLYLLKVLHEPSMFVEADELVHFGVAEHLLAARSLFSDVGVAGTDLYTQYPGLETAVAALRDVTGLPLFVCAVLLVAAARGVMTLALYSLAETLSGSRRIAALAAVLFMANGNFVFWSSQFSYESLSLPLCVMVLALVVRRARDGTPDRRVDACVVVLLGTITVTHHVTDYLMALALWALTLLGWLRRDPGYRVPGLALIATVLPVLWTLLVAPATVSYLGFVFDRTIASVTSFINGGSHRTPFKSTSGGLGTPPLAELVDVLGLLLVVVGLIVGVWRMRRSWLTYTPAGILMILSAIGYIALYPLHLFAGAWETANRGQEILAIGVGLIVALAIGTHTLNGRIRAAFASAAVVIILAGGVIDGWPSPLLLPASIRVRVGSNRTIVPEGLFATRWAARELGIRAVYAADEGSGRELLEVGDPRVYIGVAKGVPQLLHGTMLETWELRWLEHHRVDFIVLDNRKVSANNEAAYAFQRRSDPGGGVWLLPAGGTSEIHRITRGSMSY